jgi:hypothetical protein
MSYELFVYERTSKFISRPYPKSLCEGQGFSNKNRISYSLLFYFYILGLSNLISSINCADGRFEFDRYRHRRHRKSAVDKRNYNISYQFIRVSVYLPRTLLQRLFSLRQATEFLSGCSICDAITPSRVANFVNCSC